MNIRFLPALLLLLAAPLPAADAPESGASPAEEPSAQKKVYRSVGEDGSVTFTDQGDGSEEEVKIRTPNTVDLYVPKIKPMQPADERKEDASRSYSVTVTRPTAEQTIRNPTEPVAVGYTITPELRSGHEAQVIYDGQVLEGKTIDWPSRGEHSVQVRVVDGSGRELAASESVTFYVKRQSRLLP